MAVAFPITSSVPEPGWRMPGCSVRCQVAIVSFPGRPYPERLTIHDPLHHEAYGQYVLAGEMGTFPRTIVTTGSLTINSITGAVFVNGREVVVTPVELGFLSYLASRIGEICTHAEIIRGVWGASYAPEPPLLHLGLRRHPERHLIRTHLARLRAKLGPARDLVQTRPALGYLLLHEPSEARP